jgi:hypothetical protein
MTGSAVTVAPEKCLAADRIPPELRFAGVLLHPDGAFSYWGGQYALSRTAAIDTLNGHILIAPQFGNTFDPPLPQSENKEAVAGIDGYE